MISVQNLTLRFGKRVLFEDVNLKFTPGNCYGIIGANGAGKSTFVKILSGETDQHTGEVLIGPGERLAVLKQNHFEYDEHQALKTVMMGHQTLYEVMAEREAIYARENFSDADGVRASELEEKFAEMHGWEAEAEAAALLTGLGIPDSMHNRRMGELEDTFKLRVLLAQALFGNPDVLLLDEPTNHLDMSSKLWLEDFLYDFKNTVLVVSHDRHFINRVCTHVVDIDFGKMNMYVGNYDFWYMSSQLATKQLKDENRKKEDKIKELKEFVQRFSANASKSRQATSRKKQIEKLTLDDIKPSSRKYPYIAFKPEREAGDNLLQVEGICKTIDGEQLLSNITFRVERGDRIGFVADSGLAITALFQILMGEMQADAGEFKWGITTAQSYFPKDHESFFKVDKNLVDWLRQYSQDQEEGYIRGFLGRMLFSQDEGLKKCNVLSGGEKVRCMLSRMMLSNANVLVLDEPTNHLDLESITSLNNGLQEFPGTILFTSHDHQLTQTVATRIIEITPDGIIDRMMTYDEYIMMKREGKLQAARA